jgi:hypothetical protein
MSEPSSEHDQTTKNADIKTYHRGDGFAIAAVPGYDKPVILLESDFVTKLGWVWNSANSRAATLGPGQGADGIRELCSLLAPMFRHYGSAMVESRAAAPIPPEARAIERELDDIARLLDQFDPDNWPGGGGKK